MIWKQTSISPPLGWSHLHPTNGKKVKSLGGHYPSWSFPKRSIFHQLHRLHMAWTFRSLPCHSSWWSFVPPRLWFLSFTKRESGWQPAQLDSNARLPQLRQVWKGDFPLGYGIIFIPNISRIPPKIGWCSPSKTNQCVCNWIITNKFFVVYHDFPCQHGNLGTRSNKPNSPALLVPLLILQDIPGCRSSPGCLGFNEVPKFGFHAFHTFKFP